MTDNQRQRALPGGRYPAVYWVRTELEDVNRRLGDVLARLSVLSHAPAMNIDPSGPLSHAKGDHSKGGNRPGGVDVDGKLSAEEKRDRRVFLLKSFDHFKRRAAGCKTLGDVEAVIEDAERTIRAWERSPYSTLKNRDPMKGDAMFPRYLERVVRENEKLPADKRRSDQQIAWEFDVSRQYVNRIRNDLAA